MPEQEVQVIGGGLAGAEAAMTLARQGLPVCLWEMRPHRQTGAHRTGGLAELVCSNSLRSDDLQNAAGLLKAEMRRLGSLILEAADAHRVPAGGALAVDRERFSLYVTRALLRHPRIRIVREERTQLDGGAPTIVASGPLTSDALARDIRRLLGEDTLSFFDAAAPVVMTDTVDLSVCWWASRYDRGTPDYLNAPLDKTQYEALVAFLRSARPHPSHLEGEKQYFEGCMPVEEMAARGDLTLAHGPLRPVGLLDPRTGRQPYAVVQLRPDNAEGTLMNLVGFQTGLVFGEQKKMMAHIPGLEKAEIVRYGVMHRNTYIRSPRLLNPDGSLRGREEICFAGQLTGVEGYLESAASGMAAALGLASRIREARTRTFPRETAIGSLMHYIATAEPEGFQPMHTNWGLFPPLAEPARGRRQRREMLARRALECLDAFRLPEQGEG